MDDAERAWIPRFLGSLRNERRFSAHTAAAYGRDLESLVRHCDREGVLELGARSTTTTCAASLAAEHRRGLAPRKRSGSGPPHAVFEYPLAGVLARNPRRQTSPHLRRRAAAGDADAIRWRVCWSPIATSRLDVRDRAMMELFYSSGLRLAELVGLDLTDVDLKDRTVRVTGKGSRMRIVPVGRCAVEALTERLRERGEVAAAGEHALFLSQRGNTREPARRASARESLERAARYRRQRATRTCSGIPSQPTCSSRAATCARSRSCWDTPTSARRRSTRT
jgi:integrase/recombinase XerC